MAYIKKYIKKGVNVQCKNCSTAIYVPPSYIKLGRGKYCSTKCCGNHRVKPKHDTKIYLKENEDSELKELSKTSLVKNHTKETKINQSYPIILNGLPFNWLYDIRIKEAEKIGRQKRKNI